LGRQSWSGLTWFGKRISIRRNIQKGFRERGKKEASFFGPKCPIQLVEGRKFPERLERYNHWLAIKKEKEKMNRRDIQKFIFQRKS